MPQIRRISLDANEYSFRFSDNKGGTLTKCTVLNGAGTVTLYKIESANDEEMRSQVGDSHFLARNPGNAFYVGLSTTEPKGTWEIVFSGIGTFELELPKRLLSPEKKGRKDTLSLTKKQRKLFSKYYKAI